MTHPHTHTHTHTHTQTHTLERWPGPSQRGRALWRKETRSDTVTKFPISYQPARGGEEEEEEEEEEESGQTGGIAYCHGDDLSDQNHPLKALFFHIGLDFFR